ncbi:glycerophosphodiester phosphodiesterase family protein [Hyphomonadaceae bacterium BL14]|nr:glycerophosphodiester phosphodiesterase family protein [Hyphomonadaceae bacterium BL14]
MKTILQASAAFSCLWLAACSAPEGAPGMAPAPPATAQPARAALPEPLIPAVTPDGQIIPDVLRCLHSQGAALISAHRGGWGPGYPENAIETAAYTLSRGPMILEIDVRRTADGVIIALHDDTLERTTNGAGAVSEMDFADLADVRLVDQDGAVTDFAIPALEEVLDWARGRAFVQLDVKSSVPVEEVAAAVVEADAIGYAAVIVYSAEEAIRAAGVDPRVAISVEVQDQDRLDTLMAAGVAPERLMAWTGVHRAPVPDIWDMLHAADIPVAFGALWYIDADVRESGDVSIYRDIADGGVVVIATDIHWTAYEALSERQDTLAAFRACTAG